jgi:transposase
MVRIASVCDALDVLAQQYSAIGDRIHSGVMALHRGCEVSRRLAEIAGIGRVGATTLVPRSLTGRYSPQGAVLRP